jgi:hypothetical protein
VERLNFAKLMTWVGFTGFGFYIGTLLIFS